MKTHTTTLAAILALSALPCLPAAAVETGQFAPPFNLPGRSGDIRLADYKGKTVYLDFWASWCGPCKQSFPWMNQLQARYGHNGLRVLTVNLDQSADAAHAFLKENTAQFDVAFDPAGATPRAYAIKGMPSSLLIDADGKVLMVHSGFREDQRGALEQHIKQALNLKDRQ